MKEQLITYQELSERLRVKKGTLYSWVSRRRLPHVRLGERVVRFDLDTIEEWIDGGAVVPVAPSVRPDQSPTTKASAPTSRAGGRR